MNQIKKIYQQGNDPKVIVVTPLLPDHKVSKETKITLKRNDTPLVWLSSAGNNNIPVNAQLALNWYKRKHKLPPYYLMIDRDIILGRKMIDKLVAKLEKQDDAHAYAYASFAFVGYVNQNFPARPFDINNLVQHNYISSNSLFKTDVLEEVGLVTDDQYKRLLDWAFLLKLFLHGYRGVPCPEATFVAKSTDKDISAGSADDYHLKRNRVLADFVKPIAEKFGTMDQTEQSRRAAVTPDGIHTQLEW